MERAVSMAIGYFFQFSLFERFACCALAMSHVAVNVKSGSSLRTISHVTHLALLSFLTRSLWPARRTLAAISSALAEGLPLMTVMRYRLSAGDRPIERPKSMAMRTLAGWPL